MSSEFSSHFPSEPMEGHAEPRVKLLALAANAAAIAGVQRGLQGMHAGTGEHAEDAFVLLEHELGIQRGEHGP